MPSLPGSDNLSRRLTQIMARLASGLLITGTLTHSATSVSPGCKKFFITTWFGVCTTYGKVFCVFWYSTTARERETKKRNKILYCFINNSKCWILLSVRNKNKAENIAVAWFDWCSKISERCPSLCKYMRTRDLHHWLGDSCLVRRGWDVKVG